MPETPCTMIQGPLNQELIVVPDRYEWFITSLPSRQTWVGYVRLLCFEDSFGFRCEAESQWAVGHDVGKYIMARKLGHKNPKSAGP